MVLISRVDLGSWRLCVSGLVCIQGVSSSALLPREMFQQRLASPGNFLEMEKHRLHPVSNESDFALYHNSQGDSYAY